MAAKMPVASTFAASPRDTPRAPQPAWAVALQSSIRATVVARSVDPLGLLAKLLPGTRDERPSSDVEYARSHRLDERVTRAFRTADIHPRADQQNVLGRLAEALLADPDRPAAAPELAPARSSPSTKSNAGTSQQLAPEPAPARSSPSTKTNAGTSQQPDLKAENEQLKAQNESMATEIRRLKEQLALAHHRSSTLPPDEDEEQEAKLPRDLEQWEPISKSAAVEEAAVGIKELEAEFARNPTGAAAEMLRAKTAELTATLRRVIDERVREKGIVPRSDGVLQAGADAFNAVYDGVAKSIKLTEAEGMKALAEELSEERKTERVGRDYEEAKQTKSDVMDLYTDAAAARPLATALVRRIAEALGVVQPAAPVALKSMQRIMEKVLMRPGAARGDCECVCDIVRDMVVGESAAQLAQLVRAFFDDDAIVVVRLKDRFKKPSGGGWRDVMINYYLASDENRHVCEVQLVHKALLTARRGLPGHVIYGVVRNASEVLEFLGLMDVDERAARVKSLLGMGWDHEGIWRMGLPLTIKGHSDYVRSACVTPDGKYVITASMDKTAGIWLLADGSLVRRLKGHTDGLRWACVTPDGKHVVTTAGDNTARIWLLSDGSHVRTLTGHKNFVLAACVTPDGRHVVTASRDKTARMWQLSNGALVRTLEGHTEYVTGVCVTPDGKDIVTSSDDKTARVWQVSDGSHMRTLEGHDDHVTSVCVSPDGKHVVTTSDDKTAMIWLLADGSHVRTLTGHTNWVASACVTPDGKYVVTASGDSTARRWLLEDGSLVRTFMGHSSSVRTACMTPDGKHVVTASQDKTARVWMLL